MQRNYCAMKKIFGTLLLSFTLLGASTFGQQPDTLVHHYEPVKFKGWVAPAAMIGYGLLRNSIHGINNLDLSTYHEIKEDHPNFKTSIDNYIQYAPGGILAVISLTKMKAWHTPIQRFEVGVASAIVLGGVVYPWKKIANRLRPDGTQGESFPSGHTGTAFMTAEILHEELKNTHPVLSYSGYLFAVGTGALRIYNGEHWLSDVVAGAGFGFLAAKAGYWLTDRLLWKKHARKSVVN